MEKYLTPDLNFDFDHPAVRDFVETALSEHTGKDPVLSLYYAVRDAIYYDPFDIRLEPDSIKCSRVLQRQRGHCLDKACLLIACYRGQRIPARLGLARVRNHIGTRRLEELLGTDILVPHGYVEVFGGTAWVKCTPAFNHTLCRKLGVRPLEFDGVNDSLFQEYDGQGGEFMEYLEDFGSFSKLPLNFIRKLMLLEYPGCFDESGKFIWPTDVADP